ncbi:hypothetical protein KIN20_020559 [Parelaphostrongylus tenuis]|uniref:Uncharacterized protein n=1 Tax=Parelaphostrongylus tenuis TaxID=148309 RepID=A0AAD5MRG0_PARTN|nr:hypothetical protein KIN20_020559 [Parelaphostrongylus tenuis]
MRLEELLLNLPLTPFIYFDKNRRHEELPCNSEMNKSQDYCHKEPAFEHAFLSIAVTGQSHHTSTFPVGHTTLYRRGMSSSP